MQLSNIIQAVREKLKPSPQSESGQEPRRCKCGKPLPENCTKAKKVCFDCKMERMRKTSREWDKRNPSRKKQYKVSMAKINAVAALVATKESKEKVESVLPTLINKE